MKCAIHNTIKYVNDNSHGNHNNKVNSSLEKRFVAYYMMKWISPRILFIIIMVIFMMNFLFAEAKTLSTVIFTCSVRRGPVIINHEKTLHLASCTVTRVIYSTPCQEERHRSGRRIWDCRQCRWERMWWDRGVGVREVQQSLGGGQC